MEAIHTIEKKMDARFYAYVKSKFLAEHHDYIDKFEVMELSQKLTTTRTHLTNIQSSFDINLLSLTIDETEQFGILCSIDGQTCQLAFRVNNENTNTSSHSSKSYFID
ncbi:unnamed protein product [Rotaria sordida]|uniref:Uncharacterized protein n=1 Tax=Rotaria sordida TaxID=392033 RepID=A0A820BP68_9BILA|nr:unnamed protein product [Rotaria sordida]